MRPRKIDPAFLVGRNRSHPRLRLQLVTISSYLTAGIHLDGLKIHGGDKTAVLTGEGLKDVVSVEIDKQTFTPSGEGNDDKAIHLQADTGVSPDDGSNATAKLKDGRTIPVKISAKAARPALKLLSFKVTSAQKGRDAPLHPRADTSPNVGPATRSELKCAIKLNIRANAKLRALRAPDDRRGIPPHGDFGNDKWG